MPLLQWPDCLFSTIKNLGLQVVVLQQASMSSVKVIVSKITSHLNCVLFMSSLNAVFLSRRIHACLIPGSKPHGISMEFPCTASVLSPVARLNQSFHGQGHLFKLHMQVHIVQIYTGFKQSALLGSLFSSLFPISLAVLFFPSISESHKRVKPMWACLGREIVSANIEKKLPT